MYIRGADIVLVVFDVTWRTSFDDVPQWVAPVRENTPGCQVYLIGNKSDLAGRAVTIDEANALVKEIDAVTYIETSAATGQGIAYLFEQLVDNRPPPTILSPDERPPVKIDDTAPADARTDQCRC
jgi:GTPase SAR1 family protein